VGRPGPSRRGRRPGGLAGSRGEYQLAQITAELVRNEVLKLLAELART
jgi:hypothetical protein